MYREQGRELTRDEASVLRWPSHDSLKLLSRRDLEWDENGPHLFAMTELVFQRRSDGLFCCVLVYTSNRDEAEARAQAEQDFRDWDMAQLCPDVDDGIGLYVREVCLLAEAEREAAEAWKVQAERKRQDAEWARGR